MKKSTLIRLIKEELEDSQLSETDIESQIKEYYKLQAELDALEKQLNPLLKAKKSADAQQEKILKSVQMWMEINKRDNAIISKWVVKLSQVLKFKVPRPDYKSLWEDALGKVNEATKNILLGYQEAQLQFKRNEKVPSLTIEPIKEVNKKSSYLIGLVKAAKSAKELHNEILPELPNI